MMNNRINRNSPEIKYAPTKHGVRLIDRELWDKDEDIYYRSLGQDRWADWYATFQKRPDYEPDNPPRYPWRKAEPATEVRVPDDLPLAKPVEAPESLQPTAKAPEWLTAAKIVSNYANPWATDDVPETRNRTYDPETSKAAARLVNAPQREIEVICALAAIGGSGSTEDIVDFLNDKFGRAEIPSNVSPRIAPLRRKGLVEYSGKTKKSRQGQANRIWALTELGWTVVKMLDDEDTRKAA